MQTGCTQNKESPESSAQTNIEKTEQTKCIMRGVLAGVHRGYQQDIPGYIQYPEEKEFRKNN